MNEDTIDVTFLNGIRKWVFKSCPLVDRISNTPDCRLHSCASFFFFYFLRKIILR